MLDADKEEWERRETFEELSIVIRLAQEMAQRLASKTHGALHGEVASLGSLLHEVRVKVDLIGSNFD